MATPSRPSIYDVADRAGVSHMTVSRVLHGHPSIRESTRQRVLDAIDEMNYTPSSIARALATSRTMRIGVILDNPSQYGPSSTLRAIEAAARRNGYAVSAFSTGDSDDRKIDSGVIDLVTQGVDALCLIAPRASSLDVLRRYSTRLPMLVVKDEPDAQMRTVAVDQHVGAQAAVQHLIDLGHRKIMHIAGPQDWFDARARQQAWERTMRVADLQHIDALVGDWSSDSGYRFGRSVDTSEVTAFFVANDQMALGLMHGFAERGIRIPGDISIVGFDDVPDARHYLPPLTTVRQDFEALGVVVIRELLAAMEGTGAEHPESIEPTLVVRASTAPPRA